VVVNIYFSTGVSPIFWGIIPHMVGRFSPQAKPMFYYIIRPILPILERSFWGILPH